MRSLDLGQNKSVEKYEIFGQDEKDSRVQSRLIMSGKVIEDNGNDLFASYEAICKGCDAYGPVDDIGLCNKCTAKVDRDMIRKRDWDYSVSAFGCPLTKREDLRKRVIAQYGEALELLAAE